MIVPERLKDLLDHPLLHLSGGVLSLGSIFVGLMVLSGAILVATIVSHGTRSLLARRGLAVGTQFAAAKMLRYVVLAIGGTMSLDAMGIRLDALIAASAVLAVGIGFGLQNITQNFISGLILLIEQPVRKGDFVRVGETLGTVDDIGLRATHVITRDGVSFIVPNSALITANVVNHSRPTLEFRVRIVVGVAYDSDVALVRDTLIAVAAAHERVLATPPPEVRFDDFGTSSLQFCVLFWIDNPKDDLRISSEVRFAINAAFREKKIELPFPQQDVHVRSVASN
jgi:small-conductance mechanosensitive channel